MALDTPPPTTSMIHATVGLHILQNLPMPPMPDVSTEYLQKRQNQERNLFCIVYAAMLDDVANLDPQIESKYSREIIRLIRTFATSFRIDDQDFNKRLARLEQQCRQTEAVQGLSGASVLDYLVALMAEKSACGPVKLSTLEFLDNYQYQLAQLKLANVLKEVILEDKEIRAKKANGKRVRAKDVRYKDVSDKKVSAELESRKALLRAIGLPSVLFICIGPHKSNPDKDENVKNKDEKNNDVKTRDNKDAVKKTHEEANGKRNHEEMDKEEKSLDGHGDLHVVASSGETFADAVLKEWAERMHYERMRSLSIKNYQQVCATERAFFKTLASGSGRGSNNEGTRNETEKVRRANMVPYWQAMHHWPDSSASTTGHGPGTQSRIGVFNHACETAGAFNVHTGFERRARCFKCASIYLYHQDLEAVRAEADMNGCHRTEITYDWVADEIDDGSDGDSSGPTCAEALGHLLCSEIIR